MTGTRLAMHNAHVDTTSGPDGTKLVLARFDLGEDEVTAVARAVDVSRTEQFRHEELSTDDVVAIQQLVARYNFAVDGGDPDAFAGTFTPDGEFGAGGQVMRGHDELRAFVVGRAGIAPRRHLVSSIVVDGDGDRA